MRLVYGTKHDDYGLVFHPTKESVAVFGGRGNDLIIGSSGDDVISGGRGRDFLSGGMGDDVLIGGKGADMFVWRGPCDGVDTIADFRSNDTLSLGIFTEAEFDARVDYDQASGSVFVDGTLAVLLTAGTVFGWENAL